MIKIPPYLQKGDSIGLLCPAGYMSLDKVQTCVNTLQDWGYKTILGKTIGSDSENYFSGTDEQRLAEFQEMLDDDSIQAILCARGGYGMGRIIEKINFKRFKKQPKWIVGYSDITILHSHLYSNYRISSMHAPMAAAFNDEGFKNEYVGSLRLALEGKKARYSATPHDYNRKGEGIGELVGGNLALLAHAVGTSSDIKTKGRILFIEDIGEYLYNVDRMFYQLKRSGKLDRLAGLVIGRFTDMKDTDRPFGMPVYDIIWELIKEYDYPVCFEFPVSHSNENYALKVGVEYKLKVSKNKVMLEE